ncbi:MAG: hypothetical protein CSA50_02960 [Gammaproteobacteria bacterium]|nr:MAG: hypothetical protein CSA50_02960 [Gammaproteobacteria bacterium]
MVTSTEAIAAQLPRALLVASGGLSLLVLIIAARRINWPSLLQHHAAQHLFLGSAVAVAILWSIRAGILPGMYFHILGYTSLMLMMSWPLALMAAALAQCLILIGGKTVWVEVGYQYLFFSVLPILFSYGFYLMVYRRLTHNPFVYILVAGFLNAGFTHAFSDIINSFMMWQLDIYPVQSIWHDYLRYLPLMMFPEGVVNGMFITGMVVFHSRWMSTFDEDSYFS